MVHAPVPARATQTSFFHHAKEATATFFASPPLALLLGSPTRRGWGLYAYSMMQAIFPSRYRRRPLPATSLLPTRDAVATPLYERNNRT
jgi:hypothetical protein